MVPRWFVGLRWKMAGGEAPEEEDEGRRAKKQRRLSDIPSISSTFAAMDDTAAAAGSSVRSQRVAAHLPTGAYSDSGNGSAPPEDDGDGSDGDGGDGGGGGYGNADDRNDDFCYACELGGSLLMCEQCPHSVHLVWPARCCSPQS